MNICHVLPTISRKGAGLSASANNIISSLSRIGNHITVFARNDEFSEIDNVFHQNINDEFLMSINVKIGSYFSYMYNLGREIGGFNLVHSHGLWDLFNVSGCYLSRINDIPYVISPHGMLDEWALNNSKFKKKLARFIVEDKNISNSFIHALNYSEFLSIRQCGFLNPVCLVPNGVNLPNEPDYPIPACISQIVGEKKILLYLGRIHPKKGIENLLIAWNEIRRDEPKLSSEWCLLIAGWSQDEYEKHLRCIAKTYDCFDVHFIGPQFGTEKDSVYFYSDAFILPSLSEGLPMVVLEAWSHKLPVMMTCACNIPEGFEHNAALKIESTVSGLKVGLNNFFSMSDISRNEMGSNGYELVKTNFTWKSVAVKLNSIYEWILNGGSPPSCIITD
jgi:poly(glycerol-phosphate) alpha-glucosyltransferase